MTKQQLEQKKAELDREFEFKAELSEILPEGLKYLAFESRGKWIVSFTDLKPEDFNKITGALPANQNECWEVKGATGVLGHIDNSFRINFKNPPTANLGNLQIKYFSMAIEIWMEFDYSDVRDILEGHVRRTERKIVESEHHYFTGISRGRLAQIRVPQIEFVNHQVSWYGGDKTLMDSIATEEIISNLKKA